jgi:hypothetical protein
MELFFASIPKQENVYDSGVLALMKESSATIKNSFYMQVISDPERLQ